MRNIPHAMFFEDFRLICSKSADENALKKQLQIREKYNSWFDSAIHEKVLYLDQFSSEEKEILKDLNPLFSKWISSKSMVTSLKIQSKAAQVNQDGKQHFYQQYSAIIGVVEDIEDRKQYQIQRFDFWISEDGKYYYTRLTPNNRHPETLLKMLGKSSEYIHSTAELITCFLNERDNFADFLDIDVKVWSERHQLRETFSHVRKICMVHNSPSSTHWWMKQVYAATTTNDDEDFSNWNLTDMTRNLDHRKVEGHLDQLLYKSVIAMEARRKKNFMISTLFPTTESEKSVKYKQIRNDGYKMSMDKSMPAPSHPSTSSGRPASSRPVAVYPNTFDCPYCDKKYPALGYLENHLRKKHKQM